MDPPAPVSAGALILALGGASWPQLGSDGAWTRILPTDAVTPLQPANCGFVTEWSEHFRGRFEGTPLKRVAVTFAGARAMGDVTITAGGVEGGPFYALSAALRDQVSAAGDAKAVIDLRPDLTHDILAQRLAAPRRGQSLSNFLRKAAGLTPAAIGLLRECAGTPADLAAAIKAVPLRLIGTTGMQRAISTAGGGALRRPDGMDAAAGRVRRRRDARLGGADRGLPAASRVQHRLRGRRGCRGLVAQGGTLAGCRKPRAE